MNEVSLLLLLCFLMSCERARVVGMFCVLEITGWSVIRAGHGAGCGMMEVVYEVVAEFRRGILIPLCIPIVLRRSN